MCDEIKTKKCNRCEKDLPASDFYRNKYLRKDGTFGLYSNCKACHYEVNYKNVQKALKKKYHEDPEYRQRVIDSSKKSITEKLSTEEGRKQHNQYCLENYHKNKKNILEQRSNSRDKFKHAER